MRSAHHVTPRSSCGGGYGRIRLLTAAPPSDIPCSSRRSERAANGIQAGLKRLGLSFRSLIHLLLARELEFLPLFDEQMNQATQDGAAPLSGPFLDPEEPLPICVAIWKTHVRLMV